MCSFLKIMVAYDNVKPSKNPEKPTVMGLLTLSVFLGLFMMFFSLIFYICGSSILHGDFSDIDDYRQTVIYVQVSRVVVASLRIFCGLFTNRVCLLGLALDRDAHIQLS